MKWMLNYALDLKTKIIETTIPDSTAALSQTALNM